MVLNNKAESFWKWFDQMRGDLTVRQVEERARCPRGRLGNSRSGQKQPTALVCASIGEGLGIDVNEVLKRAGILGSGPKAAIDAQKSGIPFTANYAINVTADEGTLKLLEIIRQLKKPGFTKVTEFALRELQEQNSKVEEFTKQVEEIVEMRFRSSDEEDKYVILNETSKPR